MQVERALVTGASAGIGRALAIEVAGRGGDVVLVARDRDRLDQLAGWLRSTRGVEVEVLRADLTDPADRRRVEARVTADPRVDCVVNNAGSGTAGPIAESTADAEQHQVELNVTAVTRLTQVAAVTFRARGGGGILNVSSIGGFQPSPGHATYAATKAFVTSLTEAVHEELLPHGVHVTALCPGYTRTEFHARGDWDVEGIPHAVWMSPERVARAGVDALLANRAVVVPGAANTVVSRVSRVLPTTITRKVTAAIVRAGGGDRG